MSHVIREWLVSVAVTMSSHAHSTPTPIMHLGYDQKPQHLQPIPITNITTQAPLAKIRNLGYD